MPVHFGKDKKGCFAQWGSQKKYYYTCSSDKEKAKAARKAGSQGAAIKRSGYKDGLNYPPATIRRFLLEGILKPEDLREEHKYILSGPPL